VEAARGAGVASLVVSSNKTFSAWVEIFGYAEAVAAMVDRLVHHAEVIPLQGDAYRLKDRTKEVKAGWKSPECAVFNRRIPRSFRPAVTQGGLGCRPEVGRRHDNKGFNNKLQETRVEADTAICTVRRGVPRSLK